MRRITLALAFVSTLVGHVEAADLEVGEDAAGVAKPFSTIAAAFAVEDPTAGDRVIVYGGSRARHVTYAESLVIDKAVDIVAGPGPRPRIVMNEAFEGTNSTVFSFEMSSEGTATVRGIDIEYAPRLTPLFLGPVCQCGHPDSRAVLEDVDIVVHDTNIIRSEASIVASRFGTLILDRCDLEILGDGPVATVLFVDDGSMAVNDSRIVGNASTVIAIFGTGTLELHRSDVRAARGTTDEIVQMALVLAGGVLLAEDSNFSSVEMALGFSAGFPGGAAADLRFDRCTIDSLELFELFANGASTVSFTNSCVLMNGASATHFVTTWNTPTVTFVHSTLSAVTPHPENTLIMQRQGPGGTLVAGNSIFNLSGSDLGAVSLPGVTVNAGTNLVFVGTGTGNWVDRIGGNVITDDPLLRDHFTLRPESPAVDAGC
jgi:hypothetical protein